MKPFILTGALHGVLAVALGAFGAHALKASLSAYALGIWETAVQYQMFHATGLLVIGILMSDKLIGNVGQLKWAGILMNFGIVFFSGSLFILALSGIGILGAITPIGGVLFIVSWLLVMMAALRFAK